MVNVNKLKGKIVENGKNVTYLADVLGIDKSTMYRKMAEDGDSITIKEADLITKALNLTKDEAVMIFFSQFVA